MSPRTLPFAGTKPTDRALDDAWRRRAAPIAATLSVTRVMADIDHDMARRRRERSRLLRDLERDVAVVAHANITASRRHP